MPYQKSEKCYYMGLKSVAEWKAPDNETCVDSKDRYNKLLAGNLRPKPYQRAKDNNIKRWLDLLDIIQNESPFDYIRRKAQAYENGEFGIADMFVQSTSTPAHSKAKPQKCYLLGKKNIIKHKFFEQLVNELGRTRAIGTLMILDFNLIFELMSVDNNAIEEVVYDIEYNMNHFLGCITDYWNANILNSKEDKDISIPAVESQDFEIIEPGATQNDSEGIENGDVVTEKFDCLVN